MIHLWSNPSYLLSLCVLPSAMYAQLVHVHWIVQAYAVSSKHIEHLTSVMFCHTCRSCEMSSTMSDTQSVWPKRDLQNWVWQAVLPLLCQHFQRRSLTFHKLWNIKHYVWHSMTTLSLKLTMRHYIININSKLSFHFFVCMFEEEVWHFTSCKT